MRRRRYSRIKHRADVHVAYPRRRLAAYQNHRKAYNNDAAVRGLVKHSCCRLSHTKERFPYNQLYADIVEAAVFRFSIDALSADYGNLAWPQSAVNIQFGVVKRPL